MVSLYKKQQHYTAAAPLSERVLKIRESTLDAKHIDIADSLNELAIIYTSLQRYSEAKKLLKRAIAIGDETISDPQANRSAYSILTISNNQLSLIYFKQGRYAAANELAQRAAEIDQKRTNLAPEIVVTDTPDGSVTAIASKQALQNQAQTTWQLAAKLLQQSKPDAAKILFQQWLELNEKIFGTDNIFFINRLIELADVYDIQYRYGDAEELYQRALQLSTQYLGEEHPNYLKLIEKLAKFYSKQARYAIADPLYQKILAVNEQTFGVNSLPVASVLDDIGNFYQQQGRYTETEPYYQHSLKNRQQHLDSQDIAIATSLYQLAELYHNQFRYTKAEPLYKQALTISAKILSALSSKLPQRQPNTANPNLNTKYTAIVHLHTNIIRHLAIMYQQLQRYSEAETLYKQASELYQTSVGTQHQD
ncbi:hypothetical protein TI04_11870, partial [Achromatium sp. WMS2]